MRARGANHSSSGSNLPSVDIRIIDGTHGGYSNPTIPATGGTGGARTSQGSGPGNAQAQIGYFSPIPFFGTGGGQHGIAFAEDHLQLLVKVVMELALLVVVVEEVLEVLVILHSMVV